MVAEQTFMWWTASEWSAIGAAATAVFTAGLLAFGGYQLRGLPETRLDDARPYVVVDLEFRSVIALITVRNLGRTAARNLRLTVLDRIETTITPQQAESLEWLNAPPFNAPVETFAPGRNARYLFDHMGTRKERGLPMVIRIRTEYWGPAKTRKKPYVETFSVDLAICTPCSHE